MSPRLTKYLIADSCYETTNPNLIGDLLSIFIYLLEFTRGTLAIVYQQPCKISKMELFGKIVTVLKPITISAKTPY